MRRRAMKLGTDPIALETEIDNMYGKVTLYNTYQFFVQLTSKKSKNPKKMHDIELAKYYDDDPSSIYNGLSDEEIRIKEEEAKFMNDEIFDGKPEMDYLSLFFACTEKLPNNSMRTLVGNANNALKSMAGAEKMLSSVRSVAISEFLFF